MSRGHGWIERTILDALPETEAISAESLYYRVAVRPETRTLAHRSAVNRALRNLHLAGKIKRTTIETETETFSLPGWQRTDLAKHRKVVAHHEAGHAVIACVLNFPVDYATITPNRNSLGRISQGTEKRGSIRADDRIKCSLAGPIAESEFENRPYNRKRDLRGSDLSNVNFEKDLADFSLKELESKTLQLVRKHRPKIEAVAAALLKKGIVGGTEIRRLCHDPKP